MDFMVVKKINYEIEKKQQQLFLCKCKNIWRISFFLDIQAGSIIPIVCCPADTNKLTSTEYFHNPSSLTDVKNDFLTFTLQLPHDKTVSDGLYSLITQGEITRLNTESLLIRLFFYFYPITIHQIGYFWSCSVQLQQKLMYHIYCLIINVKHEKLFPSNSFPKIKMRNWWFKHILLSIYSQTCL
jgi:hypothetical protein